jgi:hypothetical protein
MYSLEIWDTELLILTRRTQFAKETKTNAMQITNIPMGSTSPTLPGLASDPIFILPPPFLI